MKSRAQVKFIVHPFLLFLYCKNLIYTGLIICQEQRKKEHRQDMRAREVEIDSSNYFKDNVTCFYGRAFTRQRGKVEVSRYSGRALALCLEWLERSTLSGKAMPGKLNFQSLQHFSL